MRKNSLFPPFVLVALQIIDLGCSRLDWQFAPPQRDRAEQLKALCGNGSLSRALTNLEMSLNFHYQTVLKD